LCCKTRKQTYYWQRWHACQQAASNRRSTYDNRRTGSISLALKFSPIENHEIIIPHQVTATVFFFEQHIYRQLHIYSKGVQCCGILGISTKFSSSTIVFRINWTQYRTRKNNTNHGGCSKNSLLEIFLGFFFSAHSIVRVIKTWFICLITRDFQLDSTLKSIL
jgi:hypothetical protein